MTGGERSEPRSRSPSAFAAPRSAMRSSLASLAPTVQYADVAAERRALGIASVRRQRRTVADVTGLGRLRLTAGPWLLDGGRTDVPAFRRSHIPTFRPECRNAHSYKYVHAAAVRRPHVGRGWDAGRGSRRSTRIGAWMARLGARASEPSPAATSFSSAGTNGRKVWSGS